MTCDNIRDFFPEALYDELDARRKAEFEHHIATCAACRGEFEGLQRTLSLMNERVRVEPTETEWAEFSDRLDERLKSGPARAADRPARGRIIPFLPSFRPAWGYGIAAVLLVAFGIYMGRTLFTGAPGTTAETGSQELLTEDRPGSTPGVPGVTGEAGETTRTDERAPGTRRRSPDPETPASGSVEETNRDALAYLERSRNLLIGLTNLDDRQAASVSLGRSREISRELYDRGNTLAVALNRPSQQQLRQLVQGLQLILLQLSNMEVGGGTPVIEMVRKGVDSKSILLKINLEAIRAALSEEEVRAARPGNRNRL